MQPNFAFTTPQILWTLTLAAQLVLLVVFVGLQRLKRFPWFAASVLVIAGRSVADELLTGRIPTFTLNALLISLDNLDALILLLVVVELARRAFGGVRRRNWWLGVLALSVIAISITVAWGHWPSWHALTADSSTAVLQVLSVTRFRGLLLTNVLIIELCLLVLVLGSRFKAGWRSHTQLILIGLSSASITQIVVRGALQSMVPPHTRAEQAHQITFLDNILNANSTVYIVILIWWIGSLWFDEPDMESATVEAATPDAAANAVSGQAPVGAEPEPAMEPAAVAPLPEVAPRQEEVLQAPLSVVASDEPLEPAAARPEVATALPQVEEAAQAPPEPITPTAKPKRNKKQATAPAGKRAKKQPANETASEATSTPVVTAPPKEKKTKVAKPAKKKAQAAAAEPPSNAAPEEPGTPSRTPRKNASGGSKRKKNAPPTQAQ